MVLQENVKNIMERKEDKRIDIRRNEPREIPYKNNKEKATEIFRPHMCKEAGIIIYLWRSSRSLESYCVNYELVGGVTCASSLLVYLV